jgi:hypothetical protein
MYEPEWLSVPVGIDAARWMTRRVDRRVLVVAHTLVSVQRLLDVVELVECDSQVQVVYTRGPDVFGRGVSDFLHAIGAVEISWRQATQERFDLALAAAYGGLAELHAPIMVLPHGAGYAKQTPRRDTGGQMTDRPVYGLGTEHLVFEGRVVPSSIVLSHERQRDLLARSCPEAVDVALVAGDPSYDRLRASTHLRADYREALGVGSSRQLVVMASTWGRQSLFRHDAGLLNRLMRQLDPRRYQVAALLHPAVWFGHGRRQVRAWLADERAGGLILIEPEVDWRAVIVATDYVIGDHGSVSTYAASIGVPVLHTELPHGEIDEQSAQAFVATQAPRLVGSAGLESQLRRAVRELPDDWADTVAARLTSRPGQAHRRLREEMYAQLGLPVPGRHRAVEPVTMPRLGGACRYAG